MQNRTCIEPQTKVNIDIHMISSYYIYTNENNTVSNVNYREPVVYILFDGIKNFNVKIKKKF